MEKDYKLGELFSIRNGVNIKQTKIPEGVPITRIETISEGFVDLEKVGYASIKNDSYKDYYLQNGDILMSHINSELHLGKVAYIEDLPYPVIHGMNLLCLKIQRPNIFSKYLFYYFKTSSFKIQLRKIIKHSVNQASFGISDLSNIIVHVPEIEQQKRIVEILDICVSLIQKRQESITLLDELVNSVFNRLFGDPISGRQYPFVSFKEISKVRQGLQIPIAQRKTEKGENCLPYITNQYLNGGKVAEYIENPRSNVICHKDDILMTRTGNTGIVVTDVEGVFHNNFFLIDYDRKSVNKEYLISFLKFPVIRKILIKKASVTTIPDLNHGDFYSLKLPLPPLPLQNQFAEIVQKAEIIKQRFQKSLEELNHLYQSLSQRAFQGKLDLSRLDVEEELEKFQGKQQIKMRESVENMLLSD